MVQDIMGQGLKQEAQQKQNPFVVRIAAASGPVVPISAD